MAEINITDLTIFKNDDETPDISVAIKVNKSGLQLRIFSGAINETTLKLVRSGDYINLDVYHLNANKIDSSISLFPIKDGD